ncbi:MAG: glycosyltransferase, group 1 family protein [Opitutae bacterium]|nr:glycosyltransferase, group 1 family protein [Opitutae bacterium]
MARIAFFHNALGKTDGVSLEVDKWRWCLEQLGHEVFYCAGNDDVAHLHCIPELSFFHPETNRILKNATVRLADFTETELEAAIMRQKEVIKGKLLAWIKAQRIEVLIPNNLLSVGYHLPALIALSEVIEETGLPTIAHNHDFYFEESGEIHPTCPLAWNILDRYSPPAFANVQNVVINRLSQQALATRKQIAARVVPNVFDFNQAPWRADAYNADFRAAMALGPNDIVLLQATRVMLRKGIELAIDVVGEVGRPENRRKLEAQPLYDGRRFTAQDRIVLLCVGHIEEFGSTADYSAHLQQRARAQGVDLRFVGTRVKHSRGQDAQGKLYSLWDSYAHADIVTYPSWWEGWGNQFVEAIFAKLPVVLFEYPVYKSDLAQDGFEVVSLGDKLTGKDALGLETVPRAVVQTAAAATVAALTDKARRAQMVDTNFEIARRKYSYQALLQIVQELLRKAGIA